VLAVMRSKALSNSCVFEAAWYSMPVIFGLLQLFIKCQCCFFCNVP